MINMSKVFMAEFLNLAMLNDWVALSHLILNLNLVMSNNLVNLDPSKRNNCKANGYYRGHNWITSHSIKDTITKGTLLINQTLKMKFLVFSSVAICSYLRCKYIARQRSTLIAVTVNRVTAVRKTDIKVRAFLSVQEVMLLKFLKSTAWNPTFSGSDTIPTHRSDKARPNSNVFDGESKCGLRHIVNRIIIFPGVAVMEIKMLRTINVINIFELKTKMLVGVSKQNSSWDLFISWLRSIMLKSSQRISNEYTYIFFLGDHKLIIYVFI